MSATGPSSLAVRLLMAPVRFYRLFISALLPPSCRYQPTCSEYALLVLRSHGALRGSLLTIRRICRCHPIRVLGGGEGYDPPPPAPRTAR